MEEDVYERLARLERRVIANRTAISLLTVVLAKLTDKDAVLEAIRITGNLLPETGESPEETESLEEAKELFVTLATAAASA